MQPWDAILYCAKCCILMEISQGYGVCIMILLPDPTIPGGPCSSLLIRPQGNLNGPSGAIDQSGTLLDRREMISNQSGSDMVMTTA